MSIESRNRSLAKAAYAAGYAMASNEEELADWTLRQPEVALRNGHSAAARAARGLSLKLPFTRFEQWIEHMLALSVDFGRAHGPRGLLPSR